MEIATEGDLGGGVFYGWWIVIASLLILTLGIGGTAYTFGVFFMPLVVEFGWSRTQLSAVPSASFLLSAFMSPFVGRLVERYGPRRVVTIGSFFGGVAFALLGLTQSLPQFFATYLLLSLGIAGMGMIPLNTVVSNWFLLRRGLALGIVSIGVGLGGLTLVPAAAFLISSIGWRYTYAVLGAGMLAVAMPLGWGVLRTRPQDMGLMPDGNPPQELAPSPGRRPAPVGSGDLRPAQALRQSSFWILVGGYALYSLGLVAILQHTIPYFTDRGLSSTSASVILSGIATMGMAGKVAVGFLADRFSPKMLAMGCFLLQAMAFAVLIAAQSLFLGFVFASLFGFSMGGLIPLQSMLLLRYFGLSDFATIFGLFTLFFSGGGALGPIIAGYVFDTTGTYLPVLTAYLVFNVAAAGLLLLLRQPQLKVV